MINENTFCFIPQHPEILFLSRGEIKQLKAQETVFNVVDVIKKII